MLNLNGKSILVVDDEVKLRNVICGFLELAGAKVFSASDGIEAIKLVSSNAIDLIISDVRMPGVGGDGMTLLKKVRKLFPDPPPFFFVTSFSDFDSASAVAEGACGLIPKPFSLEDLEEIIGKAFGLEETKYLK